MDVNKIGEISREHRTGLGLSVAKVAEIVGKHESNVYRFENGEHKDPKGYVLAYAMLGMSQEYLDKVFPLVKEEV